MATIRSDLRHVSGMKSAFRPNLGKERRVAGVRANNRHSRTDGRPVSQQKLAGSPPKNKPTDSTAGLGRYPPPKKVATKFDFLRLAERALSHAPQVLHGALDRESRVSPPRLPFFPRQIGRSKLGDHRWIKIAWSTSPTLSKPMFSRQFTAFANVDHALNLYFSNYYVESSLGKKCYTSAKKWWASGTKWRFIRLFRLC
jgi:hypothetical protein